MSGYNFYVCTPFEIYHDKYGIIRVDKNRFLQMARNEAKKRYDNTVILDEEYYIRDNTHRVGFLLGVDVKNGANSP